MTEPHTGSSSRNEMASLREVLEAFLFYVGIPALTLYPLGFVALCIQMWRDHDFPYSWDFGGFNFEMIWYAASLVPKVVVIGTGIKLMLLVVLASALSMGIASVNFNLLLRWREDLAEGFSGFYKWELLLWRLSFVTLLPLAVYVIWTDFGIESWYDLPFLAGFVVLSVVAGIIVVYARHRYRGRRLHHGLIAAHAVGVLAALSLSALHPPHLPVVELEADTNAWPEKLSSEPFVVLAHDSAHWHVYNRSSGLMAIPSAEAEAVRYWDESQEDRPTFEAERDDYR